MTLQANSTLRWCLMYVFARLTIVECQIWWWMFRQTENGKDSHHWHFLGLRQPIWGALARKKGFLCMLEDEFSYEGQGWCTMATCKGGGERSIQVCTSVATPYKLSILLSWHSPLMAQVQLFAMQDLAGHEPVAFKRASAALRAPYE